MGNRAGPVFVFLFFIIKKSKRWRLITGMRCYGSLINVPYL